MNKYRTLFLVNPIAGGGAGTKVARNIKTLFAKGFADAKDRCDVELTQPEGLVGRVRRGCADYSTIVAVGGDGTASRILRGILEEGGETLFGLIPLGTGNDLARSLGIYHSRVARSLKALRHAMHTVLFGEARPMDLFEMDGAGFFCNYAGVGLDGRVLAEYKRICDSSWFKLIRWSRGLKFLCYGLLMLNNLRYRLPEGVQISVNSGELRKTFFVEQPSRAVIVSNTRTYGGGFVLGLRSKIDDGRFEVTFVRGVGDIFRILLARFFPLRFLTSSLNQVQTDFLEWTAPSGLPFEWDGELGSGPLPRKGSIRIAGQVQVLL